MTTHVQQLEYLANILLEKAASGNYTKEDYTNRDFANAVIIFQDAIMNKMWDLQTLEGMSIEDRGNMASACGNDIWKVIHTYTGIDMRNPNNLV